MTTRFCAHEHGGSSHRGHIVFNLPLKIHIDSARVDALVYGARAHICVIRNPSRATHCAVKFGSRVTQVEAFDDAQDDDGHDDACVLLCMQVRADKLAAGD